MDTSTPRKSNSHFYQLYVGSYLYPTSPMPHSTKSAGKRTLSHSGFRSRRTIRSLEQRGMSPVATDALLRKVAQDAEVIRQSMTPIAAFRATVKPCRKRPKSVAAKNTMERSYEMTAEKPVAEDQKPEKPAQKKVKMRVKSPLERLMVNPSLLMPLRRNKPPSIEI